MISHAYSFRPAEALRIVVGPVLAVGFLALGIQALAWLGWLPPARAALDVDRVILLHQAEAARTTGPVDLLLVGDSSCLMNVDAPRLAQRLGRTVLNLGTSSYVDLISMGRMVEAYARRNPGSSPRVVLLLHPQSLRVRDASNQHIRTLNAQLESRDDFDRTTGRGRMERLLGIEQWRGRVVARLVPFPLAGAYGTAYGFTHDLWRFLDRNAGSAVDPHRFEPGLATGNAEYRLASGLEPESRRFRALVPPDWRLDVGVTPVPAGFARADHAMRVSTMLTTWAGWLAPARVLAELPAVLPDAAFASITHLRAAARADYTDRLAEALRREAGAAASVP